MAMSLAQRMKEAARRAERNILVLYLARKDPRISLLAKIFIVIVVGYALSPIDLIPDFIPVLGYLDDLILLPIGIYVCTLLIPEDILEELRAKSEQLKDLEQSIVGAAIVVGLWVTVIFIIGLYLVNFAE